MSEINDGGPAFPRDGNIPAHAKHVHSQSGMTRRQWLEGMAMQGILANPNIHPGEVGDAYVEELSRFFASAMLAEPKAKPES